MNDQFWVDFVRLAAVCLFVALMAAITARIYRHYKVTEAEAAAKIMREVKRVTDGQKIGVVTGVVNRREALIEWSEIDRKEDQPAKPDHTDPRASHAARLIKASIEDVAIGPRGSKITAAGKITGMSPNTRQKAVEYLIEQGLAYIYTTGDVRETRTKRTLADVLALLPAVESDALDKAMTALPRRGSKPEQPAHDNALMPDNA